MTMNILITAGGTSEKIDEVRYIANHSTGGLGKAIAESFAQDPATTITYIHGKHALLPIGENITYVPIESVDDLLKQMTALLTSQTFSAVIHSMAVSDYQLNTVLDRQELSHQLAAKISPLAITDLSDTNALSAHLDTMLADILAPKPVADKKISSKSANLIISLGAAAKVIAQIKHLQPATILVGFKLLVDVTKEQLQAVAFETLQKNQADFILANDLTEVGTTNHHGILVNSANESRAYTTKQAIAEGIKTAVITKLKG